MTYPAVATVQNPATELDAVNFMLGTIGAQPVASLPSTILDASKAQTILYQVHMDTLNTGWYFNSYWNLAITADGSGFLNLPANCLRAMLDPSQFNFNGTYDLVQKGTKFWDRKNQTYVVPVGTVIYADIIELIDFVDCPAAYRTFLMWKASHVFADQAMGAANVHQYIIEMEKMALANWLRADCDQARYSLFDNQSVKRVVNRNTPNSSMMVSTLTLN